MKTSSVTFEEIDREHRCERAFDAARLREGTVTPEILQEENSFVPKNTRVRIVDFAKSLTRAYAPSM